MEENMNETFENVQPLQSNVDILRQSKFKPSAKGSSKAWCGNYVILISFF